MTRWGEIKCPRCSAPPISLWESMGRSLEEGDAREARLEARIAELEAQIAAMEEGLTAVHMAGYMDGKKATEAKLAQAVEALRGWIDFANKEGMPVLLSDLEAAELTGGKDD